MGWGIKILLFFLLLVTIGYRAWILSFLILLCFVVPRLFRRRPRMAVVVDRPQKSGVLLRGSKRTLVGCFLVLLSVAAVVAGGRWSPVAIACAGILLIFSRRIANSRWLAGLEPVSESILLSRSSVPLHWVSVSEVKLSTKNVAKALAMLDDELVIAARGETHLFLILKEFAFSRSAAEEGILKRLRRINALTAPRGAFLLPLDSDQAARLLKLSLARVDIEDSDWPVSLESAPLNFLILKPKGGFVESIGGYLIDDEGDKPLLPLAWKRLKVEPLLLETFESLEKMIDWPAGDAVSSMLAGLFAAKGDVGDALQIVGKNSHTTLTVRVLSSPGIELSRVQLRALARVYPDVNR
ncbi:MAG: hypothetical protein OK422_01630 [Thaumarchaeota archaeon]|nr:hypothetical protein [Nitrososphaerota archaeon]